MKRYAILQTLVVALTLAFAGIGSGAQNHGNTSIPDFGSAKKILEQIVYRDHRIDFYCKARFDEMKNITLPEGFLTPSHQGRARKMEWEHVVPAENFGRSFVEWRSGATQCNRNGQAYKGRECARTNPLFAAMEADLWNLVPAIGAVNAARSYYKFTQLPVDTPNTFGSCPVKIIGNQVEPPEYTRGEIARATLYMAWAYPDVHFLSEQQSNLMRAWDAMYRPDSWECTRASRIKMVQGNINPFVEKKCREQE